MENIEAVIEGLEQAIEMERTLQDYYKHASRHTNNLTLMKRLEGMEERHMGLARRLGKRREDLQKQNGEGVFSNTLEAIGDAIAATIAGLPVGLIRTETDPSNEFLLDAEQRLLAHYSELAGRVDPDTRLIVDDAMRNATSNIELLQH
jgi:hypothetical protein